MNAVSDRFPDDRDALIAKGRATGIDLQTVCGNRSDANGHRKSGRIRHPSTVHGTT